MNEIQRIDTEALQRLCCSSPAEPGMYLQLYNGRTDPEQDMEDWGTKGPFIGPLMNVHHAYGVLTYLETDHETIFVEGKDTDHPIRWHDDLLFYDGVYYGDYNIICKGENQ